MSYSSDSENSDYPPEDKVVKLIRNLSKLKGKLARNVQNEKDFASQIKETITESNKDIAQKNRNAVENMQKQINEMIKIANPNKKELEEIKMILKDFSFENDRLAIKHPYSTEIAKSLGVVVEKPVETVNTTVTPNSPSNEAPKDVKKDVPKQEDAKPPLKEIPVQTPPEPPKEPNKKKDEPPKVQTGSTPVEDSTKKQPKTQPKETTWQKGAVKSDLDNTKTKDWVFNKQIERQIIEKTKQAMETSVKITDKKPDFKYESSKDGHLNISTPKKEINFQAKQDGVSSDNVSDDNLKAMAIAYRANLETRIKAGQMGLKVSLGECNPKEVEKKFAAYINREIENMMSANKDDPNFKKYDLDKLKIPTELSSPKVGVKIEQPPIKKSNQDKENTEPKNNDTPNKKFGIG